MLQAVDALGVVSVKPTEVVTKKKTPFFELKVQPMQLVSIQYIESCLFLSF